MRVHTSNEREHGATASAADELRTQGGRYSWNIRNNVIRKRPGPSHGLRKFPGSSRSAYKCAKHFDPRNSYSSKLPERSHYGPKTLSQGHRRERNRSMVTFKARCVADDSGLKADSRLQIFYSGAGRNSWRGLSTDCSTR